MIKSRYKQGFTIVELLVVIVVIGILAVITVVSYNGITQKANQAAFQSDVVAMQKGTQVALVDGTKTLDCSVSSPNNYCPISSSGANIETINNYNGTGQNAIKVTKGTDSYIFTANTAPSKYTVPTFSNSVSFNYEGYIRTFTVPTGVTKLRITTKGAQGGWNVSMNQGGLGASLVGTFTVTPGQVLSILVGQQPNSPSFDENSGIGYQFSGGGGGTFVALGSNYSTASPLIVAGGGGAGSGWNGVVGQGGQVINVTTTGDGGGPLPGTNGQGAPAVECGGSGGGFYSSGGNDTMYYNTDPVYNGVGAGGLGFRQGGAGGLGVDTFYTEWGDQPAGYQSGGFGGGSTADYIGYCNTVAGSGGGYSGGSSASAGLDYGGQWADSGYGGGSYNSGTDQTNIAASNPGNGLVVIEY